MVGRKFVPKPGCSADGTKPALFCRFFVRPVFSIAYALDLTFLLKRFREIIRSLVISSIDGSTKKFDETSRERIRASSSSRLVVTISPKRLMLEVVEIRLQV